MKITTSRSYVILAVLLILTVAVVGCEAGDNGNNEESAEESASPESLLQEDLVYENHFQSEIDLDVYWEFSEGEEYLNMMVIGPSTGWLSIGFEPSTRMQDAQIIIGGFTEEEFTLEEHFGTAPTSHEQIEENYIEEFTGESREESTVMEFVIPLGEDSRYELTAGEEYEVILAYHDDSDNFMEKHSQRTTTSIEF